MLLDAILAFWKFFIPLVIFIFIYFYWRKSRFVYLWIISRIGGILAIVYGLFLVVMIVWGFSIALVVD